MVQKGQIKGPFATLWAKSGEIIKFRHFSTQSAEKGVFALPFYHLVERLGRTGGAGAPRGWKSLNAKAFWTLRVKKNKKIEDFVLSSTRSVEKGLCIKSF